MTHNVWIPADEIKMEVLKWNKNQKKMVVEKGNKKKNEGKEKYDWLKLGKFKKRRRKMTKQKYICMKGMKERMEFGWMKIKYREAQLKQVRIDWNDGSRGYDEMM